MTERAEIFKNYLFKFLKDLSDRDFQEHIWTNRKNPTGLVSSYTEVVIGLFDDALLGDALENGAIVYDKSVTKALYELSDLVDSLDDYARDEMEFINDPKMESVRQKAAQVLALIEASDASENTVTFIEEGTLKELEP